MRRFPLLHGESLPAGFAFVRDAPSVDGVASAVAANTPRYGRRQALAGTWGGPEIEIAAGLDSGTTLLGVGVDGDTITPLVFLAEPTARRLRVFTPDAAGASLAVGPTGAAAVMPTDASAGNLGDLSRIGQTPTYAVDDWIYTPVTGCVIHGTLVAICRAAKKTGASTWQLQGVAMLYSVDYGASWTVAYGDTADPKQLGLTRLAAWACQGYQTPWHAEGEPLLAAWLCWVDYRAAHPATDVDGYPARGGRAFWCRFTRDSVAERFRPYATSGTVRVGVWTLDTAHDAAAAATSYCHIHSAGITEYEPSAGVKQLQVIVGIGDAPIAMMSRVIITDPETYWETTSWSAQCAWHGWPDTGLIDPAANSGAGGPGGGTKANDHSLGNQFVGCGAGPDPGTLIIGTDGNGEGVWQLYCGDAPTSQARHLTVIPTSSRWLGHNCFAVRVDHPERPAAERIATCQMRVAAYRSGYNPARAAIDGDEVIWFSREGGRDGSWSCVTMQAPDGTTYAENYGLARGHAYLMDAAQTRLIRRRLPATVAGRPMQIHPGGGQFARTNGMRRFVSGNQVIRLGKVAGHYHGRLTDDSGNYADPLPYQPPVVVDTGIRIQKTQSDAGRDIMTALPPCDHGGTPYAASGTGTLVIRQRFYVQNFSDLASDSPFEATRRPCSPVMTANYDAGAAGSGGAPSLEWPQRFGGLRPEPLTFATSVFVDWDPGIAMRGGESHPNKRDLDLHLWYDFHGVGAGDFPYPLGADPASNSDTSPTLFPDEIASIEGLNLGGGEDWTLLAAGLVPLDSWETHLPITEAAQRFRILSISNADGTLYATVAVNFRIDAGKYSGVDLVYSDSGEQVATSTAAAAGQMLFRAGYPFQIAVVKRGGTLMLRVACAGVVRELSVTPADLTWLTASLTHVHFGRHDGTACNSAQWFGIALEERAMTPGELDDAFATLPYLEDALLVSRLDRTSRTLRPARV